MIHCLHALMSFLATFSNISQCVDDLAWPTVASEDPASLRHLPWHTHTRITIDSNGSESIPLLLLECGNPSISVPDPRDGAGSRLCRSAVRLGEGGCFRRMLTGEISAGTGSRNTGVGLEYIKILHTACLSFLCTAS